MYSINFTELRIEMLTTGGNYLLQNTWLMITCLEDVKQSRFRGKDYKAFKGPSGPRDCNVV